MTINIPVRKVTFRRNGLNVEALEIVPGFASVHPDNDNDRILGDGGNILVSNPFIETMLSLLNAQGVTGIGTHEAIYINLVQPQNSNPGVDDEFASLTENLSAV